MVVKLGKWHKIFGIDNNRRCLPVTGNRKGLSVRTIKILAARRQCNMAYHYQITENLAFRPKGARKDYKKLKWTQNQF